jgi:hypothetical protein
LTGLLLSGERKSVEPMAARIDPRHVSARHQSMHHFVARAPWDERAVLGVARDYALAQLERHAPVAAWVVDDTGIPKKGTHSVGVARQYCGPLGKQDNCQVAVTVSLANRTMSVPCAWRLYLPPEWSRDRRRREACAVPTAIRFQPKWQMALDELDRLLAEDLPRGQPRPTGRPNPRADTRRSPPEPHAGWWRGAHGRILLPRPRLNSLHSQRDLTVTRITPADAFELDDCTPLHAVTGRGAADTPGSSTQLTSAAVHTQAATNTPDQR